MTERLRDGSPPRDADLARLAAITAAVRPHTPSNLQRQRVWGALARTGERPRVARSRLAVAIIVALIAGPVVAAAAAVATRWVGRQAAPPRGDGAASTGRSVAPGAGAPAPVGAPRGPTATAATAPSLAPATAQPPTHAERARPRTPRPARVPPSAASPAAAAPATAPDAILVVGAVQALRENHDAKRAERLLSDYLARQPDGVLSEDARALQIEAVAHDRPRAGRLAAAYLARYPRGRFRASAERALAGGAPAHQETP